MIKHQRRQSGAPGSSEDSLRGQSPRGPSEASYVGRTHFEEVRSTFLSIACPILTRLQVEMLPPPRGGKSSSPNLYPSVNYN